jgi:hypothetical protein
VGELPQDTIQDGTIWIGWLLGHNLVVPAARPPIAILDVRFDLSLHLQRTKFANFQAKVKLVGRRNRFGSGSASLPWQQKSTEKNGGAEAPNLQPMIISH